MKQDLIIKAPKLPDLKPFLNKWIALSSDRSRVISSGDTIDEVINNTPPSEKKRIAVMKVLPPGYSPFIS